MKKILKLLAFIFAFTLICTFIFYLFFSFGVWDFNPAHWSNDTRSVCAISGGSMGVILGIMLSANFMIES